MEKRLPDELAEASAAILKLLSARRTGTTICPSEAARRVDAGDWRRAMPKVHEAARALVDAGLVTLTQAGVPRPPSEIVGAYRIGSVDDPQKRHDVTSLDEDARPGDTPASSPRE